MYNIFIKFYSPNKYVTNNKITWKEKDKMKAYQLKVTITGSKPLIWRRILVPEKITFEQLHETLQAAFCWGSYHLYEFQFPTQRVNVVCNVEENERYGDIDEIESTETIDEYVLQGFWFKYIYDFGDWWEHRIEIEKIIDDYDKRYPKVLKYKGDSLPEDCGGIDGYYELMDKFSDGITEDNEELFEWANMQGLDDYDMEDVNDSMEKLNFPVAKVKRAKIVSKDKNKLDYINNGKELDKYMSELIQYLNNKPKEETLEDIYDCYTKEDIIKIAKLHHMKKYSSYKKDELISYVSAYIISEEEMTRYFLLLKDIELEEFSKVLKGPSQISEEDGDLYEYLLSGGYLALSFDMKVIAPSDVVKAYERINKKEFHEKRKRVCLISEYLQALNYLYGVTPIDLVLDIFNKYEKSKLNQDELLEVYELMALYQSDFVRIEDMFVDFNLVDGGAYLDFLKAVEGKSYYVPSKEKINQLGNVYCGEISEELYELYSLLGNKYKLDDAFVIEVCGCIEENIHLSCRMQDIFDILERAGITFDSKKEIAEITAILSNLWNNTRMITNLGFTPNELVSISNKIRNNNLIPFRKDEQKVYPNDPCPCGSGKKYKLCCKLK